MVILLQFLRRRGIKHVREVTMRKLNGHKPNRFFAAFSMLFIMTFLPPMIIKAAPTDSESSFRVEFIDVGQGGCSSH